MTMTTESTTCTATTEAPAAEVLIAYQSPENHAAAVDALATPPPAAPVIEKWTAGDGLGPRMAKEVNGAIKDAQWAARTVRELSGIIGGEERSYDSVQLFGGPTHPDYPAAYAEIGNRYGWKVTKVTYRDIARDFQGLANRFKYNPMISDKRVSPEAHAEQERKNAEFRAARDATQAIAAAKEAAETAGARALYPWAKRDGSHQANGAANMRRLLADAFPGVTFKIRSESYSMGSSIDVDWENGPTTAQVSAISDQFQDADFDGMTDMSTSRTDGDGFRSWMGYAKSVHESRRMSVEAGTVLVSAFEAGVNYSDPQDMHCNATRDAHRLFDKTPLPPGAVVTGIAWQDDTGHVITFTAAAPAPATAPLASADGITVTENEAKDGVEVRFPAKPAPSIIDALKAHGFRWTSFGACWYHKRNTTAWAFARSLVAEGGAA